MRIGVLTTTLPYPLDEGERLRVFHLFQNLPEHHDVDVFALSDPEAANCTSSALRPLFASLTTVPRPSSERRSLFGAERVLGKVRSLVAAVPAWIGVEHSRALQSLLDEAAARRPYDVMFVSNTRMCQYRMPSGVPVVVDLIDSPTLRLWREFRHESSPGAKLPIFISWLKTRRYLRQRMKASTRVIVSSAVDARDLAQLASGVTPVVITNGVDTEYFRPCKEPEQDGVIVFSGVMSYYPNALAALHFYRNVLPFIWRENPNVKFVLVGKDSALEEFREISADPRCRCTGYVDDMRPPVGTATVYVSPLTIGTGIKNKVLEALALARGVVATPLSCEGIDVVADYHLRVADRPSEFAAAVSGLLRDPEERRRLGENGRRLVTERYSWTAKSLQLHEVFEEVRRPPARR